MTTQALDCERSLTFLCKVTARETQAPSGERILREKADCKQSAQALTPMILKLKIKQGNKFGTLKKPMFSLFEVIFLISNGIIKQNI